MSLLTCSSGEETYVKGENGKIYEYSAHPERKAPIQKEDIYGFCTIIPILELNGYKKEEIEKVREIIEENNKQYKEKRSKEK